VGESAGVPEKQIEEQGEKYLDLKAHFQRTIQETSLEPQATRLR
jgi:hypothetical protein